MPYILIQVTREGVTNAQKAELIERATSMVGDVLGKDPELTFVVIEEVATDNWGVGGQQVSVRRHRSDTERGK